MGVLLHVSDMHFGTEKPTVVAALLALARQRRPDLLVLGGRIHLPYVLDLRKRPPPPRPMWCVQAGTAVSSRVRHGTCNSVNLVVTPHPGGAAVHAGALGLRAARDRFALAEERVLGLGA